jgi:ribose transport system permease protein
MERSDAAAIIRWVMPGALALLLVVFAAASPTFRTPVNLLHILVNNFTLTAIVALGMTLVVSAGGIDLSVGTAADMAAMVSVMLLAGGHGLPLAFAAGLVAAALVGVVNALLVGGLGISPFLATLGVLFVGESVQQLATNGGTPIYLAATVSPQGLTALAHGTVLGVPVPLLCVLAALVLVQLLLAHTPLGRHVRVIGSAPDVARHSGVPVRRAVGTVFLLSSVLCGLSGLLLAATVRSYVPLSGNAFLLDSIGAVFVGTTISREAKPNVGGTLLGVFLFGMLHNGLLLIGWSFPWQQVAIGLLVFAVLGASFRARRLQVTE